jgi:hypothetical protein
MKCPSFNRPQANEDWCADCLKRPFGPIFRDMAAKGHIYDTGDRRDGGLTVWVITDAGTAAFFRENGRLN